MPGYGSERSGRENPPHQRDRAARGANELAGVPEAEKILCPDNLMRVYQWLKREGGPAAGPDEVSYGMLSQEQAWSLMRGLSRELKSGNYRSSPARRIRIPKASGGRRTLRIRSIVHRVFASALHQALVPFWESHFLDISHGFRPRRGIRTLFKALERQILQQECQVLATADIHQAFDSMHLQDVLSAHHHFLQNPRLLDLVERALEDPHRPQRQGIDQGNPYSPQALNVVLHHHLDVPIQQGATRPLLQRYADDLTIAASSVAECQAMLDRASHLLAPLGLMLGTQPGPPRDLSQKGSSVTILGLEVGLSQGRIAYGIGESAWHDLDQSLLAAHEADHPEWMARQVLRGWLMAYGMALENAVETSSCLSTSTSTRQRILWLLSSHGFREIPDRDVGRWMESSHSQWKAYGDTTGKEDRG